MVRRFWPCKFKGAAPARLLKFQGSKLSSLNNPIKATSQEGLCHWALR